MLWLILEANVKYGEYKSAQIEGTQISQDEMYYLKYIENTGKNYIIKQLVDLNIIIIDSSIVKKDIAIKRYMRFLWEVTTLCK